MCLFKRDEQENTCVHEECKNYYLLNKQICMYSKQAQEPKRSKPNEEQNLLDLLQKKIKKETDLKSLSQESTGQQIYNPAQPTYNPAQPTYNPPQQTYNLAQATYSQTQTTYNPNFTLNTTLLPQTVQVKTETPNSTSVYFPLLSQQQNIQQGIHVPTAEMNAQTNFSNMSLAQMINLRNQNNMESQMITVQKPVESISSSQSLENTMREFQSKLLGLVLSQNQILVDLKEKNDLLQDTLGCLVGEVSTIKKSIKPTTDVHPIQSAGKTSLITQIIGNSTDTINSENLLTYLYGSSHEFQYQLVLKQELSLPLYRERNFKFTVMLVDKDGKIVENSNRIPLTIGIYSSENPPKYIDTNTSGNKILKGFIEKDLKNGIASFDKIQIKEVTSHFRNGWIFFVVYPKVGTVGSGVTADGNLNSVSGQKIKPLVIEKVVVKAKKTKEKGNNAEAEDNMADEAEQEKEESVGNSN